MIVASHDRLAIPSSSPVVVSYHLIDCALKLTSGEHDRTDTFSFLLKSQHSTQTDTED